MLHSATLAAKSWQCQRCGHKNNAEYNKRGYFSYWAWRGGIAPSSATGIKISKEVAGWGQPRQFVATGDMPMQDKKR